MNDPVHAGFTWNPPPAEWDLPTGVVHVWMLHDRDLDSATSFREILAPDERTRAARFGENRARAFTGVRATLRNLLARYCAVAPDEIVFSYGALGKPTYPEGGVHFSISHAGDRALLAFSRSFQLGVDLERVKHHRRFDALSARFFSPANAAIIARASESARPRVFTEAWAQREAFVKAVGGGLYATSDVLPFIPGRVPLTMTTDDAGTPWAIATLDPGEGYEAKLVVQGGDPLRLFCFAASV